MIRNRNIDPAAAIDGSKLAASSIPLSKLDETVLAETATIDVSAAELAALYTTAKAIVPAPGANKIIVVDEAYMRTLVAGDPPVGHVVAAGEDLVLRYENASGAITATCEATGFIDQTTAQLRKFRDAELAVAPLVNKALVLHLTAGNPDANGTMTAKIVVRYHIMPSNF
jgi:hypothetical protein